MDAARPDLPSAGMTDASLILVSCGSEDEARTISRGLVERGLAAGVQRFPITSVYTWKGQIMEEGEWLLVIKTRSDRYPEVEAYVLEHHSYEVPQVIRIPVVEGHGPYLDWIDQNTV